MALAHFGVMNTDFSKHVGTYIRIEIARKGVTVTLRHVNAEGDCSYLSKLEQTDVISALDAASLMLVPVEIESVK